MWLEKYLVLNKYFLHLFGAESIGELREELSNKEEGFRNNGRSFFIDVLLSRKNLNLDDLNLTEDDLLKYDKEIREYSEKLNKHRTEKISLKYFQYLSALFTEIYFDFYFKKKDLLLKKLNAFLKQKKIDIKDFEEKDLRKLALYIATGGGKTLLMHINYWQFLKYKNFEPNNIILITPSKLMSDQHMDEMKDSGIPYTYGLDSGNNSEKNTVKVIEIHLLTEKKEGSGKRVEVSGLGKNNFVLIDEGHKGQKSEEKVWKELREELGENGFIIEYSATFAQILSESKKKEERELLEEYSKAIIFDYSYKYFYEDGFGKDFYVCNVEKGNFTDKTKKLLLTANLLSFYEQLLLFEKLKKEVEEYKIRKPLWAFVGSKVIGSKNNKKKEKLSEEEQKTISDVLEVILFLKEILQNEKEFKYNVNKILKGETGITLEGKDIFENKFGYLKEYYEKEDIDFKDIYEKIFNNSYGSLSFYEIKSAEGEIGLKLGESDYFGVINIGEVSSFKKILSDNGIEVKEDFFSTSIFPTKKDEKLNINVIIGAKKFLEGWDCRRLCSMGLINMGKSEGPLIIQLFGRGVRLMGKGNSLKRSENANEFIKYLETLNIFGLNANYINYFLESIRSEGIEYKEIYVPIKKMDYKNFKDLRIIKNKKDFNLYVKPLGLKFDSSIAEKIEIDLRPKIKITHGKDIKQVPKKQTKLDLKKYIDFVDWNEIYFRILDYKNYYGFSNLIITKEKLKEIACNGNYDIYALEDQILINSFTDLDNIKRIFLIVLDNYIKHFYDNYVRRYEMEQLDLSFIIKEDSNLSYDEYKLKIEIPKEDKARKMRLKEIEEIEKLLQNFEKNYDKILKSISGLHIDKHLYNPLLIYDKSKEYILSEPQKLNEGEAKFLNKLIQYYQKNKQEFKDKEIFILRNLPKKGVGFFRGGNMIYPDFLMWIKEKNKQKLYFIDPHGLIHSPGFNDPKIQLSRDIKNIEKEIKKKNANITLESFVISTSEYKEIKEKFNNETDEELQKKGILFIEDENLMEKLFKQ